MIDGMNATSSRKLVRESNLMTCARCGCTHLARVRSRRTGGQYLCFAMPADIAGMWVAHTWEPHNCDEYRAKVAEITARKARERAMKVDASRILIRTVRSCRLSGNTPGRDMVAAMIDAAGMMRRRAMDN